MIYILLGNDTKNKASFIKELTKNGEVFFVTQNDLSKELLFNYSSGSNLFNKLESVVVDNLFRESSIILNEDDLNILKNSSNLFIFKEDKMLAAEEKRLKKFAEIKKFEEKAKAPAIKFNVFLITDAFAAKDKVNAWALYNKAIESGVEPESIAGLLFWKIKMMVINGSKIFPRNELLAQSSSIVSLYHSAHRGELDFNIGLEQFILNSLSK